MQKAQENKWERISFWAIEWNLQRMKTQRFIILLVYSDLGRIYAYVQL